MEKFPYHLGLDVGASSLGWAIVRVDEDGNPLAIEKLGVRIFNPGKPLDTNSPETPAAQRRGFRAIRRVIDRRQKRKRKTFNVLKAHAFIPANESIEDFIKRVDRETLQRYGGDPECKSDTIPYYLRKKALSEPLSRSELGRVFYHLAQRRGFLSNRKSLKKEEVGQMKKAISQLEKDMKNKNCRTLAEYFLLLNKEGKRMRNHYTSRQMYIDEFEAIFESQRQYHPELLTDRLKKLLYQAIFYQRPLRSTRKLIGFCEYETGKRRCPWWRLEAQEFRLLSVINSLTVNGKPLSTEQRQHLYTLLQSVDKITIRNLKKHLKLSPHDKVNYDFKEDNVIPGHKTNTDLQKVFPDWFIKSYEEKEYILQILASQESFEKCKRTAVEKLNLDEQKAEMFASIVLEEGYCGLSLQAIKKLLPLMREGKTYPEAVREVYGQFHRALPVYDELPPVDMVQAKRMGYDVRHIGSITNPIVRRILSEARHLINAIIKRYGKPERIYIELARDSYFTKKELEFAQKREKQREQAKKALEKHGISSPSRTDIEKYLLAVECNWQCPYTGETITMDGLFGPNPEFQIEHIIPLSRSLDNSFANKTLCKNTENQNKHNKTPYEAYAHDPARYEDIKKRVRKFNSEFKDTKLERFCMKDMSKYEDFTERLLNDTRYASRLLKDYLSYLYGGLHVEGQPRRIFTTKGSITAYMRQYFGLAGALGGIEVEAEEARPKKRDDHRHHALDALVVALTTPGMIQSLSRYAKTHWNNRPSIQQYVSPLLNYPSMKAFLTHVSEKLDKVIPVFHHRNRVRGPLHDQTYYGKAKEEGMVTQRKALESLKLSDIQYVIDPDIRGALQKIAESHSNDKTFQAYLKQNGLVVDGMPVKKVKIKFNQNVIEVPAGLAISNNNHHMEVFAILDDKGNEIKWDCKVVSLYEAYQRKREGRPIVQRDHGPNTRYKFTLYDRTVIEAELNGKRELFVIRSIPQSRQLSFVRICAARQKKDIIACKEWFTAYPEPLRTKWKAEKRVLTPLGG